jgi:histidine triad (HIT) family protein
MTTSCLFCSIVARAIPAQIVLETDDVLAFRDIRPMAPVHALVIPKQHLPGIHDAGPKDAALLGKVLLAARDVAEKLDLAEGGYRLVVNQGVAAGQSVLHLHCHVLGGRPLAWPPG